MKIKRPTPIVYDENYDESQITFMTETLIKKHLDYLKRVARPLGMTVKVKKLKSNNPNLDEQDNDLLTVSFQSHISKSTTTTNYFQNSLLMPTQTMSTKALLSG